MNRLFCIRFKVRGFVFYRNFWNESEAKQYMDGNKDWSYELVEANEIHKIWEAR